MLCFHRISYAKHPFQLLIVEVAPVDYNRLRAWSVMVCHYMVPQGFEDDLPSTLTKRTTLARWAVVVAYMQWWIIWCFYALELKVLSLSPGVFLHAAAYVIINDETESG